MKRAVDLFNALAFGAALLGGIYGGALSTGRGLPDTTRKFVLESALKPETLADGTLVLRDATNTPIPLIPYQRIASGTLIADRVLSDLCEPTRLVAFTSHGAANSANAHRFAGKPLIAARAPVESILALKPDLLIVNNLVDPGYVAQLREHNVRVFDLGHMRGLSTLLSHIRAIGFLIGAPERAEHYARSLEGRMQRVAAGRAGKPRPNAMYIGIYGDRMYGGAARTSYHDILEYAGLHDVAAKAGMDGWPELTEEQVLALDPEIIVTHRNMGAVLCRHAGFEQVRPCRGEGRIVEIEGVLIDDPGPSILDATELLYDALWGTLP
jgi:iron complex transport system substrate-binding protein